MAATTSDGDATAYSRDATINALTSFYSFLASNIPGLHPSDVKSPPPRDSAVWPDLTPLNKTPAVIDLIHHLPSLSNLPKIAPETYPINYSSPDVAWSLSRNIIEGSLIPYGAGEIPAHVAVLTEGSRYGSWLLLDTEKGTVTDYIQFEKPERGTPGPGDPDHWRAYRTLPVGQFFEEWKEKFRGLQWVVVPDDDDDSVRYRFDGETDVRFLFFWLFPRPFRRFKCFASTSLIRPLFPSLYSLTLRRAIRGLLSVLDDEFGSLLTHI